MYVWIYNPADTAVTVEVVFEATASRRWTKSVMVQPHERTTVAAYGIVVLGTTKVENFGTQVIFPPGRVGIVSFGLYREPNYGRDQVVDLSPTFLCKTPI